MDVISLKLSTGEELIARVKTRNTDIVVLDRPRTIALMPQRGAQMGLTLVPFMASNQDGEISIYINHIVVETTPDKELLNGYLQNTSGIQIVT